jgi:carbamoylphosphate synthase large subunit
LIGEAADRDDPKEKVKSRKPETTLRLFRVQASRPRDEISSPGIIKQPETTGGANNIEFIKLVAIH